MVRYRTRDLTRLLPGTAYPAFRRMQKVTGRTDDMMIVRGVNVFPTQVEEQILAVEGLTPHYLCVLTRPGNMDELTVRVEAAGDGDRGRDAMAAAPRPAGQAPDRRDREGRGASSRTRSSGRSARRSGSATSARSDAVWSPTATNRDQDLQFVTIRCTPNPAQHRCPAAVHSPPDRRTNARPSSVAGEAALARRAHAGCGPARSRLRTCVHLGGRTGRSRR